MELFLRWGIDDILEKRILLPANLPQRGIWCSTLNDKAYFVGTLGDNSFINDESPKRAIRIPLWITEEVLRQRVKDFPGVTFLRNHNVQNIELLQDFIEVVSWDALSRNSITYQGRFLACCDGAYGPSKKLLNNHFKPLSEESRILSVTFQSHDIMQKKKVPDGIFYSTLTKEVSGFLSPINLKEGIWLAQVVWVQDAEMPDDIHLSAVLDKMVGEPFKKKLVDRHFWNMQVQIAEFFNLKNQIFWLGDSAHAFAPTGGLGLNTGFGDAYNLGWKLAYVIKQFGNLSLLETYEQERYPVWMNNLLFAKKNADDFLKIKQYYSIDQDLDAFGHANAKLGNQFLNSSKLTMGYRYGEEDTSPFIEDGETDFSYNPVVEVGYFLPHTRDKYGKSIYDKLSSVEWNLICDRDEVPKDFLNGFPLSKILNVIHVETGRYPYKFLLVRPDWHIAKVLGFVASVNRE